MPDSLEASLVRMPTATGRVVSQALGLPGHSLDLPQELISLDFPLLAPRTLLTASVVQWCPLLSDGHSDIAGLELS